MCKLICIHCSKEVRITKAYRNDGLCGKCRSRDKYLKTCNITRKSKLCPICGKKILRTSKYCNSCSQFGDHNHQFKDGTKSLFRYCSNCGKKISTASKNHCMSCCIEERHKNRIPLSQRTRLLKSPEYAFWRTHILVRDDYTCKVCGSKDDLRVHHIMTRKNHPEKIFDVDNGITLCNICHKKTYKREERFQDLFFSIIKPK